MTTNVQQTRSSTFFYCSLQYLGRIGKKNLLNKIFIHLFQTLKVLKKDLKNNVAFFIFSDIA